MGVGRELVRLLPWFGDAEADACAGKKYVDVLERKGAAWCGQAAATVSRWIEAAARSRRIPISESAVRAAIAVAVWREMATKEEETDQ